MGCFLGCFGVSSKRKRRKPANRILLGTAHSKLVSYEPLDSSITINVVDISEDPIASKSQLSNKPEERLSVKIRKKVSFNLNVQIYEPIPNEETTTYRFLQSLEEEEREKDGGQNGKGSLPFLSDEVSGSMQTSSYPCNYRYQNCRENFHEEDEMGYEESDLEDDDDNSFYDDDEFESLNMDSTKGDSLIQLDELCGSTDVSNARIRSQYLCSVLNPIENTTQWKEIKARAAGKPKQMGKKNVAVEEESQIHFGSNPRSNCSPNYNQSMPLLQDVAVDASLSNWLISSKIRKPEITYRTKTCSIAFDTLQSKKSISDSTFSRSREDRVILDITNL